MLPCNFDPIESYYSNMPMGAEITHIPTRCIVRAWEAHDRRLSAFQVPMMHRVGKCVISAQAWDPAFIPWPVRNKQKLRISTHPLLSWSWDRTGVLSCAESPEWKNWQNLHLMQDIRRGWGLVGCDIHVYRQRCVVRWGYSRAGWDVPNMADICRAAWWRCSL